MKPILLINELVHFAKENINVMGPLYGVRYVNRCLDRWQQTYGDKVANKVRAHLIEQGKLAA